MRMRRVQSMVEITIKKEIMIDYEVDIDHEDATSQLDNKVADIRKAFGDFDNYGLTKINREINLASLILLDGAKVRIGASGFSIGPVEASKK